MFFQTTLCNTVIDNPNNLNKFDMAQYITNYLDTDTILFQSNVSSLETCFLGFMYNQNLFKELFPRVCLV